MAPPRVFVSHAHADNQICDRYAAALRAQGYDVWYDRNNLQNGRLLSDELERELAARSVLVVLLSEAAVKSYWVNLEVSAFRSLASQDPQRVLLPVRIGQCEIPLLMRGIAWIEGLNQPVEQVADEIARALGGKPTAGRPTLAQSVPDGRAKILAIANQKGRTGKTTTAINLGAYLADAGRKTLVVDASPDADATTGMGVDPHGVTPSIYELLMFDGFSPKDVIRAELRPNLSLLPAKVDLYAAELEMAYLDDREYRLTRALGQIVNDYDFILIDCPSSLAWLTLNALTASHGIILPLPCEYFALEGMLQLLKTVQLVRTRLNPRIFLFGVVLTMYDPRTPLAKEMADEISQHFPKERFQTVIPRNVRLQEAPAYGLTILEHDGRSPGALAYKDLAEEVIARAAVMESVNA